MSNACKHVCEMQRRTRFPGNSYPYIYLYICIYIFLFFLFVCFPLLVLKSLRLLAIGGPVGTDRSENQHWGQSAGGRKEK